MTTESEKPDELSGSGTINEIGRELLKYLHARIEDLGINQASYRQARMELLRIIADVKGHRRFNWGFEAVFTQEIHVLEELGLVAVKYGSGAIMAGRTNANQIYNLALTDDGIDTARIIVEREDRARSETSRVKTATDRVEVEPDEEEPDETDREPDSTMVEPIDDERRGQSKTSRVE